VVIPNKFSADIPCTKSVPGNRLQLAFSSLFQCTIHKNYVSFNVS
jgi:hypothetical protein